MVIMMKKGKKVIENYQIVETLEEYENEYEILLARHLTEKKLYVLKKLSIKEGNNQALYEGLLNEAKLLKLLDHQSIVKCHRMLKTSNNIYLAFSYLEGTTLQEALQAGPKAFTFKQKESIAKQLCLALLELQKASIAHLNITPDNIVISPEGTIMLREFLYAMEIPEEGETELVRRVPKSPFAAPQARRGIACLEADVYSTGKVLEKLDFRRCRKDSEAGDSSKRAQDLAQLAEAMAGRDREERVQLGDVYQALFPTKKKVKRLRSLSESGMGSSRVSRASSMSASKSQFGGKAVYGDVLLKVVRQRGMSWLLVRLFGQVVRLRVAHESTPVLALLLLKKSTKLLSNLAKYLHYGKNDLAIDINARDQARFFKTADYHKACELVDREVAAQKAHLDAAVQALYLNNAALLRRPDFAREFKEETVDQQFLDKTLREYLEEALRAEPADDALFELYLLSLLLYYQGVEEFFRQRILPEPPAFEEQLFIKKAREMNREKLQQSIRDNLDPKAPQL